MKVLANILTVVIVLFAVFGTGEPTLDADGFKECPGVIGPCVETLRNALDGLEPLIIRDIFPEMMHYCNVTRIKTIQTCENRLPASKQCEGKEDCFKQKLCMTFDGIRFSFCFKQAKDLGVTLCKFLRGNFTQFPCDVTDFGAPGKAVDSGLKKIGLGKRDTEEDDSTKCINVNVVLKDCLLPFLLGLDWDAGTFDVDDVSFECPHADSVTFDSDGDNVLGQMLMALTKFTGLNFLLGNLLKPVLSVCLPPVLKDPEVAEGLGTLNCGD